MNALESIDMKDNKQERLKKRVEILQTSVASKLLYIVKFSGIRAKCFVNNHISIYSLILS